MPKIYELHIDETLSAEDLIKRFIAALSTTQTTTVDPGRAATPTQTPLTVDEVRVRVAKARLANKSLDLVSTLEKFGAKKLSDVDPQRYPELLAEVEQA